MEGAMIMNREDLRGTLLRLLEEEMGETYPPLGDEVELKAGLNLDSVDIVGLVIRVERELRVRLSMNDLEPVRTVGDLLDLLSSPATLARQVADVAQADAKSSAA
jgi:acyl carrier protein